VLVLAQKFPGKVLLVDSAPLAKGAKPAIEWRGNLGHLSVGAEEIEVAVDPAGKALFKVGEAEEESRHPKASKYVLK
jgi:hypothetical protein